MLKKIEILTKIFIRDFYQNTKIFNKETNKLNTKSIYFWALLILEIFIIYISYNVMHLFISAGAPEVFINIYTTLLTMLLMLQVALVSTNILFYSRDLELILPLPVSSKEILLAKFNTILCIGYMIELFFSIPLILYGFVNFTNFLYFIKLIVTFFIFPVGITALIMLATIVLVKIFGFIKNRIIFQNAITIILIFSIFIIQNKSIENINNLIQINPIIKPYVELLIKNNVINNIVNIFVVSLLNLIAISILVIIGKKFYLKSILKNNNILKRKKDFLEKKDPKVKIKSSQIWKSYLNKEIKMLIKQPIFFIQTVFPVILVIITIIMIARVIIPVVDLTINNDENISRMLATLEFNSEMVCIILGILQCLFSISTISLTAISREGKNAFFMKYIPVSYYRQFLYKNILQIILNIIVSLVVLISIYLYIPNIKLINIMLLLILSIFINLINSYLMLVIDLKKPYLTWNSQYSVIKRNDNKSFQYALTIIMILIYMYISNICKELDVTLTLVLENIIFIGIFITIDRIVKRKINNLFDKII